MALSGTLLSEISADMTTTHTQSGRNVQEVSASLSSGQQWLQDCTLSSADRWAPVQRLQWLVLVILEHMPCLAAQARF
jgi:hypothetical protein